MANSLDSVVQITLTRASATVTVASFQIPLILASFTNFQERAREYSSLTELAADFKDGDAVYEIAEKLKGQSSVIGAVPPTFVVGRRQVDSTTLTPTVANNTAYVVTLNGVSYTYTSGASATAVEITAGIEDLTDAIAGINVVDNEGTITFSPSTVGANWSIRYSDNLTAQNAQPTESIVDALAAVEVENNEWYAVVSDTKSIPEQTALSDAIGARRKVYGLSTADTVAPTDGTTDIGAILSAKSAGRTYGVFLPTANTEYPEAAWAGSQLAVTPGSNDWDFKRANGVTVSRLSSTQINNLEDKNYNYYIALGGQNVFQNGNMFDGSPVDLVIGEDWLYARLQEQIYFRLINTLKIPMTNTGLVIIENEIRSVLAQAEANGLIDTGWNVQTPDVLSIPENLRAQRTAGVFVFNARLAGSVRSVRISGYLSV